MKILFICGSLQSGKDGVGDYTSSLASELIRQGHQIFLIALNDKYLPDSMPVFSFQTKQELSIQAARLSASMLWQNKIAIVNDIIEEFKPNWISLQYVPYAFNNKGLPGELVKQLRHLAYKGDWHIMFHELWTGISSISPLKHKVIGAFQKLIAKRMVKDCKANLITTSNALYQAVLQSAHIQARVLPLFSNIPVAPKNEQFIQSVYKELGIAPSSKTGYIIIGIFGSLYAEVNLEIVIREELCIAKNEHKELAFIAVGRIGKHGQEELKRLEGIFSEEVRFLSMGEQEAKHVSLVLQLLDKAISCTPGQHAGKSGVFAVMRLHNLPVQFPIFNTLPEYATIIKNNHQVLMDKQPHEWSVEYIATSFLNLLSSN